MDKSERLKKLIRKGDAESRREIKKILEKEMLIPEDEEIQKLWIEILRSRIMKEENF